MNIPLADVEEYHRRFAKVVQLCDCDRPNGEQFLISQPQDREVAISLDRDLNIAIPAIAVDISSSPHGGAVAEIKWYFSLATWRIDWDTGFLYHAPTGRRVDGAVVVSTSQESFAPPTVTYRFYSSSFEWMDEQNAMVLRLRQQHPSGSRKPKPCIGCVYYHEPAYTGDKTICGIHPFGPVGDSCLDYAVKTNVEL